MNQHYDSKVLDLWRDLIKGAENRCEVALHDQIEAYLITLLARFTEKPELANSIVATKFLDAMQDHEVLRRELLADVGDQCLLLTGLFPGVAEKRQVKVRYFVNMGQSAYGMISNKTSDLYGSLSQQFVQLMDILQSINEHKVLLPLEAYELWQELGSQRALKALNDICEDGTPVAHILTK